MPEIDDEQRRVHWDPNATTPTGAIEQKRRLATAMRLVIERLVPSDAPEDELRLAAEGLMWMLVAAACRVGWSASARRTSRW